MREVGLILTLFVFVKVYLKKLAGGKKAHFSFKSTGRALHAWVSLAGTKFIGLGATWKYYILEGAGFYDITPIEHNNVRTYSARWGAHYYSTDLARRCAK